MNRSKPHRGLEVLILQHPQEPGETLATAPLVERVFPRCTVRVGLSWRNLAQALEKDATHAEWVVLYWGSGPKGAAPGAKGLQFVDRQGRAMLRPPGKFRGLVVLDGTWKQAKSLWWRNAWLLKLRRAVLLPERPSLYGKLRREPRRECLSTLEAVATALESLGEGREMPEKLRENLVTFLQDKGARL